MSSISPDAVISWRVPRFEMCDLRHLTVIQQARAFISVPIHFHVIVDRRTGCTKDHSNVRTSQIGQRPGKLNHLGRVVEVLIVSCEPIANDFIIIATAMNRAFWVSASAKFFSTQISIRTRNCLRRLQVYRLYWSFYLVTSLFFWWTVMFLVTFGSRANESQVSQCLALFHGEMT
jgi:hypothetical protein